MNLQFAIENARAFRNTGFQPLRPLTLLVGENSSGKTSFFALLFEAINYFGFSIEDPSIFDLGGLEEIAHRQPGSAKHKDDYTVSFYLEKQYAELSRLLDEPIDGIGISISYGEKKGLRLCTRLVMTTGSFTISLQHTPRGSLVSVRHRDINITCRATTNRAAVRGDDYISSYYGVSGLLGTFRSYASGSASPGRRFLRIDGKPTDDLKRLAPVIAEIERIFDTLDSDIGGAVSPTTAMRSAPQRVYSSNPSSESRLNLTPQNLYRLKQYEPAMWSRVKRGLEGFGVASGLFDEIDVRSLRSRRSAGPFEILVRRGGIESNIMDVGYGISQALPFISDILISDAASRRRRTSTHFTITHYIQQPETHLHPSAQAAVGSFFYQLSRKENTRIILETHSDFVIDRIRQHIASDEEDTVDDTVMLFFENRDGVSTVYPVAFDHAGNVIGAPDGYRDFFIREELRNLGVLDVSDNRQ